MIPVLSLEPVALPSGAPLGAPLEVAIIPAYAGGFQSIISGANIGGSSVVFSDLNGLSAYAAAGGMKTVNRGRKGRRRTARGVEDGRQSAR